MAGPDPKPESARDPDKVFIGGEEGRRLAIYFEDQAKKPPEQLKAESDAIMKEIADSFGLPPGEDVDWKALGEERKRAYQQRLDDFRKSRGEE